MLQTFRDDVLAVRLPHSGDQDVADFEHFQATPTTECIASQVAVDFQEALDDEPKLLGARNRSEAPALARARGRL